MSKNFWVWCLLSVDLVFHDFCWRKFPTFSEGGAVRKNFVKLLGYLVEFFFRKEIFYLLVFVDISNLCFWFANLKFEISDLKCELVVILIYLNLLEFPELMLCFLKYFISAVLVTIWFVLKIICSSRFTFRWLHDLHNLSSSYCRSDCSYLPKWTAVYIWT